MSAATPRTGMGMFPQHDEEIIVGLEAVYRSHQLEGNSPTGRLTLTRLPSR